MKTKVKVRDEYISIETLFELMPVAMVLVDREGCILALNESLASISGMEVNQLVGTKILNPEQYQYIERDFKLFDEGAKTLSHEIVIKDKIYSVSAKPLKDKQNCVIAEMVALTDITKNKEIEKQLSEANKELKFLASYDSLTGALNGRTYYEICEKLMKISERKNTDFSVLFIDLDYFKKINDSYGHNAGDIVLKKIVNVIKNTIRKSDIIGRVGGEEFCVFLSDTNHEGSMNIAEKIRRAIEKVNFNFDGIKVNVTASIGVSSKLKHHKSIADIQRDADHAMYHAKQEGRNRVSFLNMPCYIEKSLEKD